MIPIGTKIYLPKSYAKRSDIIVWYTINIDKSGINIIYKLKWWGMWYSFTCNDLSLTLKEANKK